MNPGRSAVFAAIFSVLFWGFSFVSIKIAVQVFPPMTLGALRFGIALVFLFIIKQKLAPDEKITHGDIPLLTAAGLTGVTLYFFCENNGVSLVTASEASIITAAIPVLTLLIEWFSAMIGRGGTGPVPRFSMLRLTGAAVSMAGVWLVAGVAFSISGSMLGYIYMSGSAISWVTYCFLTRPLFARHTQVFVVFWQSLFGFAGFIPFTIREIPLWVTPSPYVMAHVLFLAIFCSALGYLCYARAIKVLGVGASSVFLNMIPIVTVAGGFFVLGERLHILQLLGAALVIFGVCLALYEKTPKPPTFNNA